MTDNVTPIKEYRVENLSCANCAEKIEANISQMPGVRFVNVNFAAGSMQLEADDQAAVFARIQQIGNCLAAIGKCLPRAQIER